MKWIFRTVLYLCILLLSITLLLVGLFQVDSIKSRAINEMTKVIERETGYTLSIDSIEGFLPFQLSVNNLRLSDGENSLIDIRHLNVTIAPYNLLFGSLVFNVIEIDGGSFIVPPPMENESDEKPWIQNLSVKQFYFKNIKGAEPFTFSGSFDYHIPTMKVQCRCQVLSKEQSPLRLGVSGRLDDQITLFVDEGKKGPLHYLYPSLPEYPFQATAVASQKDDRYFGKLDIQAQLPKFEDFFDGHLFIQSQFSTNLDNHWDFPELKITLNRLFPKKVPPIVLNGKGGLIGEEVDVDLVLKSFDLEQARHIYGSLALKGTLNTPELTLNLNCSKANIYQLDFSSLQTTLQGSMEEGKISGDAQISASLYDSPFSYTSHFDISDSVLNLTRIHLQALEETLEGSLWVPLDGGFPTGKLEGSIAQLSHLPLPFQAKGSSNLQIHLLKAGKEEHQVHVKGSGKELKVDEWECQSYAFNIDLSLPKIEGDILFEANGIKNDAVEIDTMKVSSSINDKENWPFQIALGDAWTKENFMTAKGIWHTDGSSTYLQMEKMKGNLSPFKLSLNHPFQLNYEKELLSITPIEMTVGEGLFYLDALATSTNLKSELRMTNFPAKVLGMFLPPEFEMEGNIDLKADMTGTHDDVTGTLDLSAENLELKDPIFKHFTTMQVNLHTVSEKGFITFDSTVKDATSTPFLAKGRIPIQVGLLPFKFDIKKEDPINLEVLLTGEIAPILDFFVTDTTNISGFAELNVTAQGSWNHPEIDGKAIVSDGTFESLNTGAVFKDVEAIFMGDGEKLVLQKLKARDGDNGKLVAKGLITLDPKEKFPFELVVNLDNVVMIQQDYARVSTSGEVAFLGNLDDGSLEGKLTVDDARLTIPEEIPVQLKTVDVTYINTDDKPSFHIMEKKPHWPIHLDVNLQVPSNAMVNGRDLHSEWKGDIQFKGTTLEPQIQGTLNLITGTYSFNGRIFESRKGSVNFNGDPNHKTSIYVVAEEQINNLKIEAILKGPIQDPVLTFRSNPPLPQKEILSWLLFNRGVEDITPFQGQELNKTEFTLSGGTDNPDLLSRIRQSFGIDRVDISNTEKDDTNEVSVRVGKYISKGLFVSVSKSINAEANQVALEANLTKHVKVQAEVGDNAQGKMSLKWENDY